MLPRQHRSQPSTVPSVEGWACVGDNAAAACAVGEVDHRLGAAVQAATGRREAFLDAVGVVEIVLVSLVLHAPRRQQGGSR